MLTATSVVEDGQRHWGRFLHTPTDANPAAALTGLRGAFESFRTKEWAGFTITHPEFFSSMIIQDAKYLLSSEWYLYDAATKSLAQHAANARAGSVRLPANILRSEVAFAAKGYRVSYSFNEERIRVRFDLAAAKDGPAATGELILDPSKASPPLVVSARLPKGSMYTNKIIFPAAGSIRVGEREYVLDPDRDFAILDEHKSRLPYRARWTWGTFAQPVEGGYVGANFAIRPQLPDQQEESCIWTPDAAEPLANIIFSPLGDSPSADWSVRSADGRLDVVFSPFDRKDVNQQLVLAEIRYSQMYGVYSGTLRGEHRTWQFDAVHGVLEKMAMRA
ncbi:MAG: DUF2804 domain-containing protein [Bifidobacteriaceae bacterium]|jgi:hypothetical protein|nr:DUF2804 domain-containing protein [Bifidobacteriaceae bacterium]